MAVFPGYIVWNYRDEFGTLFVVTAPQIVVGRYWTAH